jgi:hypothetical protein
VTLMVDDAVVMHQGNSEMSRILQLRQLIRHRTSRWRIERSGSFLAEALMWPFVTGSG